MSAWFSNKGQVVQATTSTLSLLLAAAVAIQQGIVPAFWALVAIPLGTLLIWRIARGVVSTNVPKVGTSPEPTLPPADEKPTREKVASWEFEKLSLTVGQRWKREDGLTKDYQIRFLSLPDENRSCVRVELRCQVERFLIGAEVQQESEFVF